MAKNTNKKSVKNIKEDKSFQILKLAVDELKEKYDIAADEIFSLIEKKPISKEILIPVSIYSVGGLSALEATCKHLKEDLGLNYAKIAGLLNRDSRTIWTTYNNAAGKRAERLQVRESRFFIPLSVFANRKLSVLGAIVSHLKLKHNLRYSEIAALLNRDERNIWTVFSRSRKKAQRKNER